MRSLHAATPPAAETADVEDFAAEDGKEEVGRGGSGVGGVLKEANLIGRSH